MMVSEAMNRAPVAVEPEVTIEEAEAVARRTGADHLLVLDEQMLVGILCACDLRDAEPGDHVSDRMSVPVITVRPGVPLEEAATTLRECAVGCLPVAVGGLILGTIADAELARGGLPRTRPHRRCHRSRSLH